MEFINKEYFEKFRSKAMEAIKKKLVDNYFEISVKTGEGVEKLMNSIKMDSLMYLQSLQESMDNLDTKRKIKKKTEKSMDTTDNLYTKRKIKIKTEKYISF